MKIMQNITELMIKDHERLANLFNDFKGIKNKDLKKARELFLKFGEELRKHFIIEERIINSAFDKKRNKGRVNLLPIASSIRLEHDKINNILENISASIRNKIRIDTSELYLILRHHKNIEERLFYPRLDEVLSEKEKIFIFDNMGKQRG